MKTDSELIATFQNNRNPRWLRLLIERHARGIYNVALGMLGNHADAEDVTQETFLRFIKSAQNLKDVHSFKAWLTRIAVTASLEVIRSRKRKREHEAHAAEHTVRGRETGMEVSRSIFHKELKQSVFSLPLELRIPVVLSFYQGLTYSEIGATLDCSVSTVSTRI